MKRFKGRAAIVTGAASGIGAAVADRLGREGAQVGLFDSDAAAVERQAATLAKNGAETLALVGDIRDDASVEAAFNRAGQQFGRLDVLVHCAGIVGKTGVKTVEYPLEEFRRVVDINLTGSFIACQRALPRMLKQGYGRILLVASMAGKDGNPGMSGYVASKAGLIGVVKAMGKEYAQSGVTINGLAPAVIATAMNAMTDPGLLQWMRDLIPMKRLGTVDEAASIACWIVSEEASFNTGAVFDLSGGRATY